MIVVVLLGAPGAGKGTQAVTVAERLGLLHVATGDLFRAAVREGTALGLHAREYMAVGRLVPDEVTIEMLLERLGRDDAQSGVVLDGFPRTVAQAGALHDALAERAAAVSAAVLIEVPLDELVRRLADRWVCRQAGHAYNATGRTPRVAGVCDVDGSELYQRDDDRAEVIRARLAGQLDALEAVVGYYRDAGLLRTIDGLRSVNEVTVELLRALPPIEPRAEARS